MGSELAAAACHLSTRQLAHVLHASHRPLLCQMQVHYVPTVHLPFDNPGRDALRAYASQPGATATLGIAILTNDLTAPAVIDFSSRGPSPLSDGFVPKPDILASGA